MGSSPHQPVAEKASCSILGAEVRTAALLQVMPLCQPDAPRIPILQGTQQREAGWASLGTRNRAMQRVWSVCPWEGCFRGGKLLGGLGVSPQASPLAWE